jgi:signal transduction histidine kinase
VVYFARRTGIRQKDDAHDRAADYLVSMRRIMAGISATDLALAGLVLALCEAQVATGDLHGPLWVGLAAGVVLSVCVAGWRKNPWAALIIVFAATVTTGWLGLSQHGPYGNILAGVVVVYGLASTAPLVPAAAGLSLALLMVLEATYQYGFWNYALGGFILSGAAIAGRAMQNRRALITRLSATSQQLRDALADLEASREDCANAAVATERVRIARELHDVIAHAVSVIVIQAGAAEEVLADNPESARQPLVSVQASARQALNELRRLLEVLRTDSPPTLGLSPQPGLADLDDLAVHVRAAGLTVNLRRLGTQVILPTGVDLAAYRIVQEALTNVLKHARATNAAVEVRYRPNEVELEVVDDGQPMTVSTPGVGAHGLIGMRERAALYDGELHAGQRPGGGYAVTARLSLASRR